MGADRASSTRNIQPSARLRRPAVFACAWNSAEVHVGRHGPPKGMYAAAHVNAPVCEQANGIRRQKILGVLSGACISAFILGDRRNGRLTAMITIVYVT